MRIAYIAAIVLYAGLSPLRAAAASDVTVTPVITTETTASGQRIVVPPHPELVVSRYAIAPGAVLPVHEHPYARYAYVLAGTLEVTVVGGKTYHYKTGDFFAEVVGQWHSGRNVGAVPVLLLVIDQAPPGKSNTILRH